jgi:hypothetical protein
MPRVAIAALSAIAIGLALFGFSEGDEPGRCRLGAWLNSCRIKDNNSTTGERIYHVPDRLIPTLRELAM